MLHCIRDCCCKPGSIWNYTKTYKPWSVSRFLYWAWCAWCNKNVVQGGTIKYMVLCFILNFAKFWNSIKNDSVYMIKCFKSFKYLLYILQEFIVVKMIYKKILWPSLYFVLNSPNNTGIKRNHTTIIILYLYSLL